MCICQHVVLVLTAGQNEGDVWLEGTMGLVESNGSH